MLVAYVRCMSTTYTGSQVGGAAGAAAAKKSKSPGSHSAKALWCAM